MPVITIGGDRINYAEGCKTDPYRPTVLMIHGAGQRIATWKHQLELLGDDPRYNVIAPDLPGHGESQGKGCGDIEGYKRFIEEFALSLGLSDLVLLGHSMGGAVAMAYALDHTKAVKAIVLAATGARMRVAPETLDTVKNNYQAFCDAAPSRMIAPGSPEDIRGEFKDGLLRTSPEICYRDLVACDEFDIMEGVREIECPSCIISAELDILTPPRYGEYLRDAISGSSYYLIRGSRHFMMLEKPREFNTILTRFLMTLEP